MTNFQTIEQLHKAFYETMKTIYQDNPNYQFSSVIIDAFKQHESALCQPEIPQPKIQHPEETEPTRGRGCLITWTASMIADLGQMNDFDVAQKWDLSMSAVNKKRLSLNIESYRKQKSNGARGKGINWTGPMIAELGTMTDKLYAEKWGLTESAVFQKRRKLKIPSNRSTLGKAFRNQ